MKALLTSIRAWLDRPGTRRAFKVAGLTFVVLGTLWSAASLNLTWSELSPGLLLLNLLILAPLNFVIAGVSLRINARALDVGMTHGKSLYTVAVADIAELLPLPAGAFVRGAALVNAGASIAQSTQIVLLTSVLTLLMTLCLSLTALGILSGPIWAWLALASGAGLVVVSLMLFRMVSVTHIAPMFGIRILLLMLTLTRLVVAFATFGSSIGLTEAALYVIAPTLGAAVAIVPAGLGLNEAIAAGLASLIAASSASAFLAVALNRVLSLAAGGVIVFAMNINGSGRLNRTRL